MALSWIDGVRQSSVEGLLQRGLKGWAAKAPPLASPFPCDIHPFSFSGGRRLHYKKLLKLSNPEIWQSSGFPYWMPKTLSTPLLNYNGKIKTIKRNFNGVNGYSTAKAKNMHCETLVIQEQMCLSQGQVFLKVEEWK